MTDTISALFSHRLFGLLAAFFCWLLWHPALTQVTYDGNGTLIGTATGIDPVVQNVFTVPAGTDRLLLVCITRDGPGNPTTFSVTFNGQSLSMEAENMGGAAGLVSQVWYLPLGCGDAISSSVEATFQGNADVIVGAASFQDVDQIDAFGASNTGIVGNGSNASININTSDTSGLVVAMVSTDVSPGGPVTITPSGSGQIEAYEGSIGNNSGAGSYVMASGGSDTQMWMFSSSCNYQAVGVELLFAYNDQDGDGAADCEDGCPDDPTATDPGMCGCGVPDVDEDEDGILDCLAGQIYVDIDATGNNDGTTWANAFTNLSEAIDSANAGDQIWVAEGLYTTSHFPRDLDPGSTVETKDDFTFHLKDSVAVYGGFTGIETQLMQRNPVVHQTILSGDQGNKHARHVVLSVKDGPTTILDGFTIQGGLVDVAPTGSVVVEGEVINKADGAGAYLAKSDIQIHNIIFQENTSLFGDGGVMYCSGSSVQGNYWTLHPYSGVVPDSLNDGIFLTDVSSLVINHFSSDSLFNSIVSRDSSSINMSDVSLTSTRFWGEESSHIVISHLELLGCSVFGRTDSEFDLSFVIMALAPAPSTAPASLNLQNANLLLFDCQYDCASIFRFESASDISINLLEPINPNTISDCWGGKFPEFVMDSSTVFFSYAKVIRGYVYQSSGFLKNCSLTIEHSFFNLLLALRLGDGTTATIRNTVFQRCGIILEPGAYAIVDSCFIGYNDLGPGISLEEADAIITNTDIVSNAEGGIRNYISSPTISKCRILDNTADLGAGIFNDSLSSPTIDSVLIEGNQCSRFFINGITSFFVATWGINYYGGGMANVRHSSPIISNSQFKNNSARQGGGMFNLWESKPILHNVQFIGNEARMGGGVMNANNSTITGENVFFIENHAREYQDTLALNPEATIAFGDVNAARAIGGGICHTSSDTLELSNTLFYGNIAHHQTYYIGYGVDQEFYDFRGSGGALFIDDDLFVLGGTIDSLYPKVIIRNGTFYRNRSLNNQYAGGGTEKDFVGSVIYYDFDSQGDLASTDSIELINTVALYFNESNDLNLDDDYGFHRDGPGPDFMDPDFQPDTLPVILVNSIIQGDSDYAPISLGFIGHYASNYFKDPYYPMGPDQEWGTPDDGLVPAPGGPLIDAGSDSLNSTLLDLAGNDRIIGERIDIGGYEFLECPMTTTYSNGVWSNGPPTINHAALFSSDYTTSSKGSLITCACHVQDGATLTVDPGDFVKVQGDTGVHLSGDIQVLAGGRIINVKE